MFLLGVNLMAKFKGDTPRIRWWRNHTVGLFRRLRRGALTRLAENTPGPGSIGVYALRDTVDRWDNWMIGDDDTVSELKSIDAQWDRAQSIWNQKRRIKSTSKW